MCTTIQTITCGVSWGSVLGQVLFLISISDIQHAVTDAKVTLFVVTNLLTVLLQRVSIAC